MNSAMEKGDWRIYMDLRNEQIQLSVFGLTMLYRFYCIGRYGIHMILLPVNYDIHSLPIR